MDHRADGDGVAAILVGEHERLLGNAADAEDSGVGLVDDRQSEHGAELAWVRDGEGGTVHVRGEKLLAASAFAKVGDAALQSQEIFFVSVL